MDQNQTVRPALQEASDTLPRDGAWPSQLAVKSIWRRSGGLPARPCWRWVVPLLRGLGARVAGAPGAPGRSPVGAASGRQLCSGLLSRGEFGREGSERRRARRAHTPHSRSVAANWLRVGVGGESCAQRPLSTGPGSGSQDAKAASPVASGQQAAPGAPGPSGSLLVAQRGWGSPRGPRPSAFPPQCLTAPAQFQTPGEQWGRHRPRFRAIRAALRSAGPVREAGDHAQRQVGRVLGANFGVPRPSVTRGLRSSATQATSGGHKCSSAPPEHSDLPRPPSALPCCGAPAAAAAAGAVPKGQAAASAGNLASGACRAARLGGRSPPGSGRCPPSPPAASRFSSRPSSCRRRCSGGLSLLAPFPPPGSAPRARKVEFRGFKLLIGISHCCVTRGGGDTHAAHSHTLTLKATSGSGLKGEAALPRPRPRRTGSPKTPSSGPAPGGGQRKAATARGAYRAVRPLFEKESGRRLASLWSPRFSSQLQPGQPGSNGRQGRGTGTLTSVAPHAAGDDRCPRRQVACLDGAPLARGDSGVTERPRAQADGAGRRAASGAPRAAGILSASGLSEPVVCALVGRRASWESGRTSTHQRQGRRVPDQRRPQEARERERSNPRVALVERRPERGK